MAPTDGGVGKKIIIYLLSIATAEHDVSEMLIEHRGSVRNFDVRAVFECLIEWHGQMVVLGTK